MINTTQVLKDAGFKQVGNGSWKRSSNDPNEVVRVQVSDEWFVGYGSDNGRLVCGSDWELESVL